MPLPFGLSDYIYIKGILVGVLINAPIGTINIVCIRRTLVHGRLAGYATGLGAAIADLILGAVAVFGLGTLIGLLDSHRLAISLGGAAVLVVFGVITITREPPRLGVETDSMSLLGDVGSTIVLTLSNPITVLSLVPIMATFGITLNDTTDMQDWLLLAGIFTGSAAYWALMTTLVGAWRGRLTHATLRWINRIAGCLILFCAVYLLVVAARVWLA